MTADKTPMTELLANAAAAEGTARELAAAVAQGVAADAPPAKTFNTHSNALIGRLHAEEASLRETVADIDAQIARLNEERTDAMLAHSGVGAALRAIEGAR